MFIALYLVTHIFTVWLHKFPEFELFPRMNIDSFYINFYITNLFLKVIEKSINFFPLCCEGFQFWRICWVFFSTSHYQVNQEHSFNIAVYFN